MVGFSVREPDSGHRLGIEGLWPGFLRSWGGFPSSSHSAGQSGAGSTHRGEAAPVLPDDGTEAQEASQHDEGACEDEDVGGGGEGAGGQDTEVAALLHQGPDTHGQDGGPAHL